MTGSSTSEKLGALVFSLLMVLSPMAAVPIAFSGTAAAANGSLPINEGFGSTNPNNWDFYKENDDSGTTATSGFTNNEEINDPSLLLTDDTTNQAGTALYSSSFSSSDGITAEFRYYTGPDVSGADGFTFFLLDESDLSGGFGKTDIGDSGGALGYGDSGGGAIKGGFLGIGFDEYGNFDETDYSGSPLSSEQEITIRGSTDTNPAEIVNKKLDTKDNIAGGWRQVRITVDPNAGDDTKLELSVYVDYNENGTYTEVFAPKNYSISSDIGEDNGMPSNFRLGFSGSTGGQQNYHAIDYLNVTKPTDLETSMTSGPSSGPYQRGDKVEYTFDVTNNGPNRDSSVTLSPSVATDASGLQSIDWDKGADGSFEVTDSDSITVDLSDEETMSVTMRGTIGADATGDLDHDITARTSDDFEDPSPGNTDTAVSVELNDAPAMSTDARSLNSINEDDTDNSGTGVSTILSSAGSTGDVDGDTLGAAVTSVDDTDGTWEYSTDSGSSWQTVASASPAADSALLLADDDDIRFIPNSNFNGDAGGSVTVRAWDQFIGSAGDTGTDTTTNGGTTAFATDTADASITVNGVNDPPTANAGSDKTVDADEQVSFDATGSSDVDGDSLTYDWDIDDDGTDEYTDTAQPSHTYSSSGTYTVTLTADDGTTTATDTLTVDVQSTGGTTEEEQQKKEDKAPPTADAGEDITVDPNELVTLDGSGSTDDMGIDNYEWDFTSDGSADGFQATKDTSFSDPGTYTATLTVTDVAGKTDTDTVTITVGSGGEAPTADAGDSAADEGAVALASLEGGERNEIRLTDGSEITGEFGETSKTLGPATTDLDGDGAAALPYVVFSGSNAGNLQLLDADGDTTTLVEQGQNDDGMDPAQSQSILGIGRWQGNPLSVYYVNKSKTGIYRVAPDEGPEAVAGPEDGASAVLGVADLDGDDETELVFLDKSETVQYLEANGTAVSTEVTVGANNGLGAGAPAYVDDDGTPRVPIVTDGGDLALVDADGKTTLTSSGPAEAAPVAASDLDGDGTLELAFVGPAPDRTIQYVDDVGGDNSVTETDGAIEAFDRAGVVPSATSQAADERVENGTAVEFDASGSSDPDGSIDSYEWDVDGDGSYEESGATLSHTFSEPGTHTVRVRVTDDEGLQGTDTYTVVVERSQADIQAGLTAQAGYHGNLANTGHYTDESGPAAQPEILWKQSLDTVFANQPTVANGKLYVATHDGGKLRALDAATGDQQWAATPGGRSGTTWSAPAVVNGTLYVGSNDYKLHAIDAESGEELGYYPTNTNVRSAPAVVNDTVYFGANEGIMFAVNATELRQGPLEGVNWNNDPITYGNVRWAYKTTSEYPPVIKSNPAVVNGTVYFGHDGKAVVAADAATGEEVWTFDGVNEVQSDPTVVDGTVYIGSDSLDYETKGDGHVYALNAENGDEEWSHTMAGDVDSGQAYADGVVYAGSRGGDFVALDAADGSVVWEQSGDDFRGAPIVADDTVYVQDFGSDTVHAFDADTGDELWAFDSPSGYLYGTPAVHDGKLFYGANRGFYALGQPSMTVSDVNVTNPDEQSLTITIETTLQADSLSATLSGAESASFEGSDFAETEIAGGYRYTTTYDGSSYGTYNVSVETTDAEGNTDSGEDGVFIEEPIGLSLSDAESTFETTGDPVVVDGALTVTGSDQTDVEGAEVSIGAGLERADTLDYDDSVASDRGITGSYDPTKGILTLSGTASPADYQAVLRTVTFATTDDEASTADRTVSFSIGKRATYSAATGHYYEYVDDAGITWPAARDAAADETYFGLQGYLVTVTSAGENGFVSTKIDGNAWMGAADSASEGTWRWVTGPEGREAGGDGGHFFDQQGTGGESVDDNYANWANGEPNDWGSGEDKAHFYARGDWNDFAADNSRIDGYIVEYGGMPDDPVVDLSDTTNVSVQDEDTEDPTADAGGDLSTKEGTAAVFDAGDSADNVGITEYNWDFGDGATATGEKTTYVYDDPGTYEATLTVTDEAGNTDTATVSVTVEAVTLVAKTGLRETTVEAGETVTYNGRRSDSSEGIDAYAWDFDGDDETDARRPIQQASFGSPGEYTTALTVTDAAGNTARTETTLTVTDSTPPIADAGAPRRTVDEDEQLTFDAGNSTDNGEIAGYEWDLTGDGSTDAIGERVGYTFEDPGTYEVMVTVVDEGGNEATDIQTVEVRDVTDPVADAGDDIEVGQGTAVVGNANESSDNVGVVSYGWDIDGDNRSERTGERVSIAYEQPGTYPITLVTTDAAGNTDTAAVNATVRDTEAPRAVVTTDNVTAELGATIQFNASASTDNTGIGSFEWDFGDGSTEQTESNPVGDVPSTTTHTYEEDGEYEVTLTAIDTEGNEATDMVNVTVLDTSVLVASGSATNATVNAGKELTLDAGASEASAGIDAYAWDVDGDGTDDATGETHAVTFAEPGNETVRLRVTDRAGNEATTTINVTVTDVTPPVAATAGEERTVPEDEPATLDATASSDNDEIASYEWDVDGDGQPDVTGAKPPYTFENPGEYTVALTVTDAAGNSDTTTMVVEVTDETPPQVVAGDDRTAPQNEDVTFDAGRTSDNGEIESYEWDVDADGQAEFSGETLTTSFAEIGTHNVTVTATDAAGNTGSDTVAVEVTDGIAPVADAGGSLSALEGSAVAFDATNSTDNVGVTEYAWDFGDGSTAAGDTPSHTYENDGRYTVTMTARDAAGNEATDRLRVAVVNGSVLLVDAGPSRIETGQNEPVAFDARSSEGDAPLDSYEWDFDGDGETDATGPTPTHAFAKAGVQTVVLTVTDSAGNTATDSVTVDVADTTDPTASAGVSDSPVDEGTAVAFYGTSSSDNTEISEYRWDFDGDGLVDATGATPTHTFEDPGTYTAEVTVVDAGGNTARDTVTVVVTDATPPSVDIGNDVETAAGSSVQFDTTAEDNVAVTGYEWDLTGDGQVDTRGESAAFTYEEDGNYTAALTVRDAAGNRATDSVAVRVINDSVLVADAGPDWTVGPSEQVEFDGTESASSAGIAAYEWDFDDGSGDTRAVTRHAYPERGTYDATLTVTDMLGNDATATATVRVQDVSDPAADISGERTVQAGRMVVLSAADSHDDRGVEQYRWNMGDGNVVTTSNPTIAYRYNGAGTYPVTLRVSDPAGNTDTDAITVDVVDEESEEPALIEVGANESREEDPSPRDPDNETVPDALRIDVEQRESEGGEGPTEAVGNQDIAIENAPTNSSLSLQLSDDADTSVDTIGNIVSDRLDVDTIGSGDFDMAVETSELDLQAVTAATETGDETTATTVENTGEADGNVSIDGIDRETVDMSVDALSADGQDFVDATGARPAGYIEVDHSIAEREIDGASHHFRVRQSYLDATGVGPADVQLYRDEESGWNDLETRYVGESDGFHHYTAESPGLSLFTIGAHTPVFEIADTTVVGGDVVAGEQFTVNVTVDNIGNANGTYNARLVADGAVVDTQRVNVSTGGTQTVALQHTFTEKGDHSLAIGNLEIESVSVEDEQSGLGWFVAVPLVGLLLLVILGLWRRREDEQAADETDGRI